MDTILSFVQDNVIGILLAAAMVFLVGCASVDNIPDPYKTGKTAYSIIRVTVDKDDIKNVDKVIDDIAHYTSVKHLSNDNILSELSDLLLKKYDRDMVFLITNILGEYWGHIDSAYLKGKLSTVDGSGKIVERIVYFVEFIRGLTDQKELYKE